MKRIKSFKGIFLFSLMVGTLGLNAQTVTLTFTAKDAGNHYVQLNQIIITNLTKSWQETIYWPDTVLTMQNGTGIDDPIANGGFALSQNNPNPFSGTTDVTLTVVEDGDVNLDIADINGHIVETHNFASLQPSIHQFRITLSTVGTYVMTARQNGKTSSIKMICNGGGGSNTVDYLGMVQTITVVLKSSTNKPFNFGDQMEYVGYATINGTEVESQRIMQAQNASQDYTLQFAETQAQLPNVTTNMASNITTNTATCGGTVISDGGASVTARGVCWSTSPNPTLDDNYTLDGSGTGAFTSSITGLAAHTMYYVRAYATNSAGTAYGTQWNFMTSADFPSVTTLSVSNETATTAISGGIITSDGGASVTARGVCWSTSQNPTLNDSHTSDGSGTGSFTSNITDLSGSTTYYVRAYATNSTGTAYGNEVSFTTLPPQLSTISTSAITDINLHTAISGGCISFDGGATVTARGVCWSTSHNPTINDNHTSNGSDTGSFISCVVGLHAGTTYYVRAYATNSVGTAYGNEVNLTTAPIILLPTVSTTPASNVTQYSATSGGNVIDDGGAPITARGVCWGTSHNPTISNSFTIDGNGLGNFTSSLSGLVNSYTYYVRAYATNSAGTAYGNEIHFKVTEDGLRCPNAASLTDYDGIAYSTVLIGNQCWMKENLRSKHYTDGSSIQYTCPNSQDTILGVALGGRLYDWNAVMHGASSSDATPSGVQGICPNGWHVPSDAEWTQLTDYVSSQSRFVCGNDSLNIARALAAATSYWHSSSTIPCSIGDMNYYYMDQTGFSAFPIGIDGYHFEQNTAFWSSTALGDHGIISRLLSYNLPIVSIYLSGYWTGMSMSVRCLSDATPNNQTWPTVTTDMVINITDSTATCGGNVTNNGTSPVIARGVCWSTSQNPVFNSITHTSDGGGTGSFTSSITGLTANTTYYVRAYVTYSAGTVYGNEVCFMTPAQSLPEDGLPCPNAATVTDYDGNTYNTVRIGSQCWMQENLRTTHYSNGVSIAVDSVLSYTTTYRYYPNNDSSNVSTYGYLYNWSAVMNGAVSSNSNPSGVQGICPNGWHVPSWSEWMQLRDYVRSQNIYQCNNSSNNNGKALSSTIGWENSTIECSVGFNPGENNATGFSALPAGWWVLSGAAGFGVRAFFWSTTENYSYSASSSVLGNIFNYFTGDDTEKDHGASVRCLKD